MESSPPLNALIIDWGGVLTAGLGVSLRAWAEDEGLDFDSYLSVVREWFEPDGGLTDGPNPIHALERGEMSAREFESVFAGALQQYDGRPVNPDGLLNRMFSNFERVPAMYDLIRRAKGHGLRTALLSNSWGDDHYPRAGWDEMFDAVVISGEVGRRKPESEIFWLTCERLGVSPPECVFVDDLEVNVEAAVRLGMVGVRHRSYDETAERLESILGLPLTAAS
ncbi:MAG: HAD-IA family hydrolase [Propionibacteriales bacterium]|nr:HAD-IA family hydrolase [Propionibacteriales bacterium]